MTIDVSNWDLFAAAASIAAGVYVGWHGIAIALALVDTLIDGAVAAMKNAYARRRAEDRG